MEIGALGGMVTISGYGQKYKFVELLDFFFAKGSRV
jgi:hypothetical protein